MYGCLPTDGKWMSCDEWARASQVYRDVLKSSTVTVYTVLHVPYVHTVYVYQYWNSLSESISRVPELYATSRLGNTLCAPLADLTALPLQLGTTSGTW